MYFVWFVVFQVDGEGKNPYLVALPHCRSPEVCQGMLPGEKSDIFVLGIILYMTRFGMHPLLTPAQSDMLQSDKECMNAVMALQKDDFASADRYPDGTTSDLVSLCGQLLQPDPADRLDIPSVLKV